MNALRGYTNEKQDEKHKEQQQKNGQRFYEVSWIPPLNNDLFVIKFNNTMYK